MELNYEEIIQRTELFVKDELKNAESGHDWFHIQRVVNNAINICKAYPEADLLIVTLSALLHDIDDWKFAETPIQTKSETFLKKINLNEKMIEKIKKVIDKVSYKGAGVDDEIQEIEGKIVQDADRLDALGAIGIARAFSYGGFRNREMYNPEKLPTMHNSFEDYKKNINGTTINHFHEKLLLLKDRMKTEKGKELALERHKYMEIFLNQFNKEWNGEI